MTGEVLAITEAVVASMGMGRAMVTASTVPTSAGAAVTMALAWGEATGSAMAALMAGTIVIITAISICGRLTERVYVARREEAMNDRAGIDHVSGGTSQGPGGTRVSGWQR